MIHECANFNYLLDLDFEYGAEILDEIFMQKAEKEIKQLYYYANPNGINAEHKTYDDFKKSAMPKNIKNAPAENLSVEEIMEKAKNTLDLFKQE